MFLKEIKILNFRKITNTVIELNKGVNAFVGENNSGKTAIIDAIRLCLGARSYEMNGYITEDDFNNRNQKIDIQCKFTDLTNDDISKFLQYLTYEDKKANLYVNLVAENGVRKIHPKKSTGKNYDGEQIEQELLDDIICTYLKPLRDAESELSAKKYSRISKILESKLDVKNQLLTNDKLQTLQNAIKKAVNEALKIAGEVDKFTEIETLINDIYFNRFLLKNECDKILTRLSPASSLDIRSILEKFELSINGSGRQGLGYNNILFMAAEMLLLEEHGGILLIEEPEAHLHPQLQLCFMQALEEIATEKNIQVIISTHSVTLASKIPVEQLILVTEGQAFSLAKDKTKLDPEDYKFLSKFLDATKANLFFARGVLIVEGDAENILLPSIAKVIGKDLTSYGVSIVKIGHKDDNPPYANIFKRAHKNNKPIPVKVCCMVDTDDYNTESSEETDKDGIKYVKLNKTFEYYLMIKSDIFKNKILEICKTLKPQTDQIQELTERSTEKDIYEICFVGKKISKTEVALRLAIAIEEKVIKKDDVEKLTDVIAAIKYVTTGETIR